MTETAPTKKSVVVNGDERSVEAGTLAELLEELDLDPRTVAVEHNGEVVRRSRHVETSVREDDRIEIVRFVQGGCYQR
ncbi:MAG: sulfur carrier protein ThiS [Thermoanaerobaculia bacterium]|nr:sulfur carrier protein ThiS [Thermoanaerobaculia bacterium]